MQRRRERHRRRADESRQRRGKKGVFFLVNRQDRHATIITSKESPTERTKATDPTETTTDTEKVPQGRKETPTTAKNAYSKNPRQKCPKGGPHREGRPAGQAENVRRWGRDRQRQGQGHHHTTKTHHPPHANEPKCPCPLLKFAPYFPQNLSLSKKTLEICEIGLGKYEGLPKAHQENFGKAVFWADMVRSERRELRCAALYVG